jgi:hypothetical protein
MIPFVLLYLWGFCVLRQPQDLRLVAISSFRA